MIKIRRLIAIVLIVSVTSLIAFCVSAADSNQSTGVFVKDIMDDKSEWMSSVSDSEYEFYPHTSDYNLDDLIITVNNSVGDISITTSNLLYIKVNVRNAKWNYEDDSVVLENNMLKITNPSGAFFSNNSKSASISITVPSDFHGSIKIESSVGDVIVDSLKDLQNLNIQCSTGDITVRDVTLAGGTTIVGGTGDIELYDVSLQNSKVVTTTGDISFSGKLEGTCGFDSNVGDIKVAVNGNVEDYSVVLSGLGNCSYNSKSVSSSYTYEYESAPNNLVANTSVGKVTVSFK